MTSFKEFFVNIVTVLQLMSQKGTVFTFYHAVNWSHFENYVFCQLYLNKAHLNEFFQLTRIFNKVLWFFLEIHSFEHNTHKPKHIQLCSHIHLCMPVHTHTHTHTNDHIIHARFSNYYFKTMTHEYSRR